MELLPQNKVWNWLHIWKICHKIGWGWAACWLRGKAKRRSPICPCWKLQSLLLNKTGVYLCTSAKYGLHLTPLVTATSFPFLSCLQSFYPSASFTLLSSSPGHPQRGAGISALANTLHNGEKEKDFSPRSLSRQGKLKWKSLSRIRLFVTPWTNQSMEFSRPEYWIG